MEHANKGRILKEFSDFQKNVIPASREYLTCKGWILKYLC